MSIDSPPARKTAQEMVRDLTTEHEIMDGVAVHTTSRTLIGRDAELTEIASLLGVRSSRDSGAEPAHVVLSGDAGVGKTRLLVELRDLAVAEEWRGGAGAAPGVGARAPPPPPLPAGGGRAPGRRPPGGGA